jgi:ABC-type Fe3+-hydroxamate transport system substrate-binding protein
VRNARGRSNGAAQTVGIVGWSGDSPTGYQPQTLTHAHGTTEIKPEPRAVAAVGTGDAQAALSLGVQPRCVIEPS